MRVCSGDPSAHLPASHLLSPQMVGSGVVRRGLKFVAWGLLWVGMQGIGWETPWVCRGVQGLGFMGIVLKVPTLALMIQAFSR